MKSVSRSLLLSRYAPLLSTAATSLLCRSSFVVGFSPVVQATAAFHRRHHLHTTTTKMPATTTVSTEDPYIFLEEVESEESLNVSNGSTMIAAAL